MESKAFSLAFDEKLIHLVRENPVLYDTKHKNYKDTMLKQCIWKAIAVAVGKDFLQCQIRWKTIRDSHRRHLNRIRSKTRTGYRAFIRSKYSSETLSFLDTTFKEQTLKCTNGSQTGDGPTSSSTEITLDGSNIDKEMDEIESLLEENTQIQEVYLPEGEYEEEGVQCEYANSGSPQETFRTHPPMKKKKTSKDNLLDAINIGILERNKILQNFTKDHVHVEQNPVNIFFNSMAEVVKKFPPELIAETRMKICNLVSEMELRFLQQSRPKPSLNE